MHVYIYMFIYVCLYIHIYTLTLQSFTAICIQSGLADGAISVLVEA